MQFIIKRDSDFENIILGKLINMGLNYSIYAKRQVIFGTFFSMHLTGLDLSESIVFRALISLDNNKLSNEGIVV